MRGATEKITLYLAKKWLWGTPDREASLPARYHAQTLCEQSWPHSISQLSRGPALSIITIPTGMRRIAQRCRLENHLPVCPAATAVDPDQR